MADFDIAKAIEEFMADPSRDSLELPHMTTGQRKSARKLAEEHPEELKCESYGFGQDRQLHLFKRKQTSLKVAPTHTNMLCGTPAFSVKNTFIDDFSGEEREPIIFRSTPAPLNQQLLEALCSKEVGSPASSDDVSTTGSHSQAPSEGDSPLGLGDWQVPELSEGLQVRNTFIHIEESPVEERAIKSMPHGMFGQCLAEEQHHLEENVQEAEPAGASGFLLAPLPQKATFLLAPLLDIDSNFQSLPDKVVPPPSSPPTTLSTCIAPSTPPLPPPPYEALLPGDSPQAKMGALQPGSQVILQGLIKLPAFNGQLASVEFWDAAAGRYAVSVKSEVGAVQQAMVRPDNLRPMAR